MAGPVLVGEDGLTLEWPANGDLGIVPQQCAIIGGSIKLGHLVSHIGSLRQGIKAMREATRDPYDSGFYSCQPDSGPFPESFRARADVHRHVKDFPLQHANQLPLLFANLIMESAQNPFLRVRLIVLDKSFCNSAFRK